MTLDDRDLAALLERVPGWQGRARVARALDGGITNRNLLVEVDGESYVLRLAGKDTELLEIRRPVEREAATRAAALELAPEVVAFLQPEGYLVTRFVAGHPLSLEDLATPQRLAAIATMLRAFHASGPLAGDFNAFRVPLRHKAAAASRGVTIPADFGRCAEIARRIEVAFAASPEPARPCHNDLLNANFLADGDRVWLLDWEYAGNNDRYFDLGNLSVNNELDDGGRAELLRRYFGRITDRNVARLTLMMIMSDFRESMWGVVQQGISSLDFDYANYSERHFDRLLARAADPRFESWLDAAARGPADA